MNNMNKNTGTANNMNAAKGNTNMANTSNTKRP
jgi:hypothetical protein